jgi:hypothetical protein
VTGAVDGLDFVATRFLDMVRKLDAATARADQAEAKVTAVEAVLAHARKVSPSPSMTVYVSDVERALGHDAPVAHKHGQADHQETTR